MFAVSTLVGTPVVAAPVRATRKVTSTRTVAIFKKKEAPKKKVSGGRRKKKNLTRVTAGSTHRALLRSKGDGIGLVRGGRGLGATYILYLPLHADIDLAIIRRTIGEDRSRIRRRERDERTVTLPSPRQGNVVIHHKQ